MLSWLQGYNWSRSLPADILAGVAVSALLIPESLGYAVVAGLPPEVGLFAAPLALVGYAIFGGGRIVVVATASAVSAVSASAVAGIAGSDLSSFVAMSAWLAILSGLVYAITGLLRMGWIANFMSKPVIDGFIIGLAIFIISGQVDGLVGVSSEGENAVEKIVSVITDIGDWHMLTVVIGGSALALLFLMHRFIPKVPAALAVMGLAMVSVALFDLEALGVEVVGALPRGLPEIGFPSIDVSAVLLLIPASLAVTLVGFSEGFAGVKSYAQKDGMRVDTNRELVAFGVSNIGAGLTSGMVVGGSLSKTAASDGAGAKTQMTNLVAAVVVILALLFIGPIFAYLPGAILAAVVIHAVWGLIKPERLRHLWRANRFDFAMAVGVMIGTLLLEPIYAVILGVAVSILYIVYQISFPYRAELGIDPTSKRPVDLALHPDAHRLPGILIYRMDASLLYPNAEAFQTGLQELVDEAPEEIRGVVIDCEVMAHADTTGIEALVEIIEGLQATGVAVYLARVRAGVMTQLHASDVFETLDENRVTDRVEDAVEAIERSG